jgi:hypothetical protein
VLWVEALRYSPEGNCIEALHVKARGHVVVLLLEALRYNPEGHESDSLTKSLDFSIDLILSAAL